ncbi:MAG: GNAT family N-acetyltransferase [Hyphomicrobiaceae bacterium]
MLDLTTLSFRDARSEDLHAVVGLLHDDVLGREREVRSDPPAPEYQAAFAAIDRDPNQRLRVAVVTPDLQQEVVGCLQLSFIPGLSQRGRWRAQIEGVRVASRLRGLGIGRQLIEDSIAIARDAGCGVVQLTSSLARTDARRFYEGLGFAATHAGFKLDLRS